MLNLMLTILSQTLCHVRSLKWLGQQKKTGMWTRLDMGQITQQPIQDAFSSLGKRNFSTIDNHSDLPCSKKQVLKNDEKISIQMVEAGAQPRQEQ